MNKALVYSPYFDSLGGGEKYVSSVMRALSEQKYEVQLAWRDKTITSLLTNRYDFDLTKIIVKPELEAILKHGNLWQRYQIEHNYDVLFVLSDGSLPFMFAKRNWLHFQVPFHHVGGQKLINQFKLTKIETIICNSKFTKHYIDAEFGVNSTVIYPPAAAMPAMKKKNIILSVGRFDNLLHSKRQDILIQAFNQLNLPNWKLILMGGVLHGKDQVSRLSQLAQDNPNIDIVPNASYSELQQAYGEATIYWHAAGYGQDVEAAPERAEHFGISTVEAMSAGAIPIVFGAGGQLEIVNPNNGYVWHTIIELRRFTLEVISSERIRKNLAKNAQQTSQQYDYDHFRNSINELLANQP